MSPGSPDVFLLARGLGLELSGAALGDIWEYDFDGADKAKYNDSLGTYSPCRRALVKIHDPSVVSVGDRIRHLMKFVCKGMSYSLNEPVQGLISVHVLYERPDGVTEDKICFRFPPSTVVITSPGSFWPRMRPHRPTAAFDQDVRIAIGLRSKPITLVTAIRRRRASAAIGAELR